MELFKTDLLQAPELLAQDEALLEYCETTQHSGFVTFWESMTYFVVLGYSKVAEQEVFEAECARQNIPVLRRCSGGGTVLQGPGCVNYAVVLPIDGVPELETITGANRYIMGRIRAAVASLTPGSVEIRGHTDLTLDGLKFSGNAQRRKRRALLFHGSFLLQFDLSLITETLREPAQQPDYRAHRSHGSFLTNLNVDRTRLQLAIAEEWNARQSTSEALACSIREATLELVRSKYAREEWIRRAPS